jgi:hypothetical protein
MREDRSYGSMFDQMDATATGTPWGMSQQCLMVPEPWTMCWSSST